MEINIWVLVGIGLAVLLIGAIYFVIRMPKCPICKQRKHVVAEMYGGYYCTACQHSFETDPEYT